MNRNAWQLGDAPFCSVVIPTFNRRSALERTLSGILDQSVQPAEYEVIVVDDASRDDTPAFMAVAQERASNLKYVRHATNAGRSATRNDGIRSSRGDVVIFLDDDNVPCRSFVEAHRSVHQRAGAEHVAVMGNPRFAPEAIEGSNFGRFMQSRYLGFRDVARSGIDPESLPARCLGTLNCSMRRTDLVDVGLFDEAFRLYGGEDEFLGHCLAQRGVRIVFGEAAQSVHHDEVTIPRYKKKLLEGARGGLRIMMQKSPSYVEGTALRLLLPVRWRAEGWATIAAKLGVRLATAAVPRVILETWAVRTDRIRWLYCWPVYRALLAAWVAQGYHSRSEEGPLVTYGEGGSTP